ncbi:MAG: CCA tRNA nucleotidyltransferase [Dehalococcoidia bacterium]
MNLSRKMAAFFPAALAQAVKAAGEAAAARGWGAYLVGGAVRDMLLERPCMDVDLSVEGDAIAVAHDIAGGLRVVAHPRFGTATLKGEGWDLDLATARQESYPHPGALPVVSPGPIAQDLLRRDFTINAMAIDLSPGCWGELVDPYGGQEDISRRLLRVLHPMSFVDDATRFLRGLRYQGRFGFTMEARTLDLLRRDRAHLRGISGHRLRRELEVILREDVPERALRLAVGEGVLPYLALPLSEDSEWEEAFARARGPGRPSPAHYLCLLAYHLTPGQVEALVERLSLPRAWARAVRDTVKLCQSPPSASQPPSQLTPHLEGFSSTAVAAHAVMAPESLARSLRLFLRRWRYVKPALSGNDLRRLGVAPGPQMGGLLHRLRAARLDGEVKDRTQEEALVRRWLEGEG